jgi:hypothetical protein
LIIFAGGAHSGGFSNVMDIFQTSTKTFTATALAYSRYYLTVCATSRYAFFAGGHTIAFGDKVEIFDGDNFEFLSVRTLSVARTHMACAAVSDRVYFAGLFLFCFNFLSLSLIVFLTEKTGGTTSSGTPTTVIDILSTSTFTFITAALSAARQSMFGIATDSRLMFLMGSNNGAVSNIVDVFDVHGSDCPNTQNEVSFSSCFPSVFLVSCDIDCFASFRLFSCLVRFQSLSQRRFLLQCHRLLHLLLY